MDAKHKDPTRFKPGDKVRDPAWPGDCEIVELVQVTSKQCLWRVHCKSSKFIGGERTYVVPSSCIDPVAE